MSSAYLRLLIFLPAILIPACASSSVAFLMMYSAYKLNKQGDNIQPWRTPFPILNQSVVPRPVLNVASWPAYKFLEAGQVVWYSHIFQNFPQFIVIVSNIVNNHLMKIIFSGWQNAYIFIFHSHHILYGLKLYLKWITNKDLLYSMGKSAQCYVAAWMGGEFGGEWIHVYVWLSHSPMHMKLSKHC